MQRIAKQEVVQPVIADKPVVNHSEKCQNRLNDVPRGACEDLHILWHHLDHIIIANTDSDRRKTSKSKNYCDHYSLRLSEKHYHHENELECVIYLEDCLSSVLVSDPRDKGYRCSKANEEYRTYEGNVDDRNTV